MDRSHGFEQFGSAVSSIVIAVIRAEVATTAMPVERRRPAPGQASSASVALLVDARHTAQPRRSTPRNRRVSTRHTVISAPKRHGRGDRVHLGVPTPLRNSLRGVGREAEIWVADEQPGDDQPNP